MISFRPAQSWDLEEIIAIENSSFDDPWSTQLLESEFLKQVNEKWPRLWVAEIDDKVIAYLDSHLVVDELQIMKIAVRTENRGRGVASNFMQNVEIQAKKLGAEKITLEVRVSNIEAINLYKKLGFAEVSIRENYYNNNEDALLMDKIL